MTASLTPTHNVEKVKGPQDIKETASTGTLKTDGKEHEVYHYKNTGDVTADVSEFLNEVNSKPMPEELNFDATVDLEQQIAQMKGELARDAGKAALGPDAEKMERQGQPALNKSTTTPSKNQTSGFPLGHPRAESRDRPMPPKNSSIFSLARDFGKSSAQADSQRPKMQESDWQKDSARAKLSNENPKPLEESIASNKSEDRGDERQQKDQQEHEGQGQHQEQQQPKHKAKAKSRLAGKVQCASDSKKRNVYAAHDSGHANRADAPHHHHHGGSEDIFYRFMALMARILGQAEAEAHDLYQRIKGRTDDIDTLTKLMSKINSNTGPIDWSNNEEMKQLLAKARSIGVDIPADKYKWTEEEKKLFKENIQMKKDSMEKVTQLERTDMQRYLQEASQCHQARSNVLKLMKEVTDTIIANMRP